MATRQTSSTYTSGDLEAGFPTLRLTLNNEVATLVSSRPQQQTTIEQLRKKFTNLFHKAKQNANFEANSSEAARKRNEAKLDKIFDDMVKEVNDGRNDAKASLQNLTPEQQEELVMFWSMSSKFFMNVMTWMQHMFQSLLEKIRDGFTIVKQALKDIFDTIGDWLEKVF